MGRVIQFDVDGLKLPERLIHLIESGIWPTNENVNDQWDKPIYRNEDIWRPTREYPPMFFYPPPFHLVKLAVENNPSYWLGDFWKQALGKRIADGIVPEKAVDLGDFGAGSDAAIILDYRKDEDTPVVLGLDWGNIAGEKGWVILGNTFDEFANQIGLP